jgi:hypothetical protein
MTKFVGLLHLCTPPMLKLPSIFKTQKHRSFNFRPRYYDADKEAFEERIRRIESELDTDKSDVEATKLRIRQKFQNRRSGSGTGSNKASNIRVLVILGILGALAYWILK